LEGSLTTAVGAEPAPAVKGLPATGVSPEELTAKPETVPDDGHAAGRIGTVPVTGGDVVTRTALGFAT